MLSVVKNLEARYPLQRYVPFLLAGSCFALPLSSTAKSIFIVLSLICIVFSPAYTRELRATLSTPWCQSLLGMFCLVLLGCCWGPASAHDKLFVLEKYSKLLYIPVLAVGFRDPRARFWGLHGFLLAMLVTCFLCVLNVITTKHWGHATFQDDPSAVFRNRIMTSYMMAFAAFIAGMYALHAQKMMRCMYFALMALMSYQVLFINTGRTGYIMYILLMSLLIVQCLTWRRALLAFVGLGLILTASYQMSSTLQERSKKAFSDYQLYQKDQKDTSIGFRLQFHDYAHKLFNQQPWFGHGTASFTSLFALEKPVPAWNRRLWEPHSQYWLTASELGVLGIVGLFAFFVSVGLTSWRLTSLRSMAWALLISFLLGNLTDSLLFYSGSGYFFILLMALCFGESVRITREPNSDSAALDKYSRASEPSVPRG